METLLLLLVFPLVWPFVAKYTMFKNNGRYTLSFVEVGLNIVIVSIVVSLIIFSGTYFQTRDEQIINGKVTNKYRDTVSCDHSYSCNCDKDGNCSTCYEHLFDYDWIVESTIGEFTIDRVNRQGTKEPPRFTRVVMGEPVSRRVHYTNYIKGSPDSLFSKIEYKSNKWIESVPEYPSNVYDYWYVDRVIGIANSREWSRYLQEKLKDIGPVKQVNAVIVFTKNDRSYSDAIKFKWLGGKKNDVVVVIGSKDNSSIEWVEVISWAKNNVFQVALRDELQAFGKISMKENTEIIMSNISRNFQRREMKEFEYLKDGIDPPNWVIVFAVLISIFGSIFLSWIFHKHSEI